MMTLTIHTKETKLINQDTLAIVTVPAETIVLEHSLYAISKWESIWHDQFLKDRNFVGEPLTTEQLLSYLQCMSINGPNDGAFDILVYRTITAEDMERIKNYMEDPMTGTHFNEPEGKGSPAGSVMSSEEIYYAMIKWRIPVEFQHWHINRLMVLLRVFGEKENPKKLTQQEAMQKMYAKNQYRQAQAKARRK